MCAITSSSTQSLPTRLRYEFFVEIYINGVLQTSPNYTFGKGDQIEMKYSFHELGKPKFTDYMNFLHEAYKMDSVNVDLNYAGAWVR